MAEKNAQTVYRNRDGRRIDREEWVELQQKKRKKRASDYPEQEHFNPFQIEYEVDRFGSFNKTATSRSWSGEEA